jgi:phosphatidylglycerophosphate synthase
VSTPGRAEYLARWSALHGGYDPSRSRVVGWWLALSHAGARPFVALGVPPSVVTVGGLLVAGGAAALAFAGGGWLWLAAVLVLLSGLLDGLDGAVAVLSGRTSAGGYVLDSVVDRCSDLLYVVALWGAGAPGPVSAGAGALALLHEYLRARATAAGMTDVGVVTVWERPTRVVVTAVALLGAAAASAPGGSETWAAVGAWAWVVLGVAGLGQLAVVVRRRLAGSPPPA